MSEHPNSKKITIFRTGSFLSRAQSVDIAHHFADAKVSVGSYYESRNSQKIASGLSMTEEALLLPSIIDLPKEDRGFRKGVSEFYKDINTVIPVAGCILEIGLEKDNAMPVSETNLPIALMDYLRYRQAKLHPFMGTNKEEAEGNALKQYYIFDPEQISSKGNKRAKDKDTAYQLYLSIKTDANKVDQMLTLLGTDPREFTGKNKDDDKIDSLRNYAETDPAKFTTTYNTADLEVRYWVETMRTTGVLKLAGGKYYNGETQELIGNTLEETMFWFKDDDNSNSVVVLKGMMQEALKKAPEKKKATTKALAGKELRR